MKDEGLLVLGVVRANGPYLGAPGKNTVIQGGDTVILYGRDVVLAELDARPADARGDRAHRRWADQPRGRVDPTSLNVGQKGGAPREQRRG